jgi:hypothetical protein
MLVRFGTDMQTVFAPQEKGAELWTLCVFILLHYCLISAALAKSVWQRFTGVGAVPFSAGLEDRGVQCPDWKNQASTTILILISYYQYVHVWVAYSCLHYLIMWPSLSKAHFLVVHAACTCWAHDCEICCPGLHRKLSRWVHCPCPLTNYIFGGFVPWIS